MNLYQSLSSELNLTKDEIDVFALSAPKKYKVYSIPKRTSGRRTIAHPSKELKLFQREVVSFLEPLLPVHSCSFAYKKGMGIKKNAQKHAGSKYLLKMDFESFFNSISNDVFLIAINSIKHDFSFKELNLLINLLFWCPSKKPNGKLVLSVGAPSSPLVSNFIMNEFDKLVHQICVQEKITYTRYADDITFSTNIKNSLFKFPERIRMILKSYLTGFLSINESKTVYSSTAHNRHVTGVTLTNQGGISLGRKRKRYISSLIFQFSKESLPVDEVNYLKGLIAFSQDIEPEFIDRMKKKYSVAVFDKLDKR